MSWRTLMPSSPDLRPGSFAHLTGGAGVLLATWLGGCRHACLDVGLAGISVTVIDAETKERICDASLGAGDGTTARSLILVSVGGQCQYAAYNIPPGEYEVLVSRRGYDSVQLHDVEVREADDGCSVETARREVALSHSP